MAFEQYTVDSLIQQSNDLCSLPEVYHQVSALLDDELSTPMQISAVILNDPAIAARVLKTVNSAFYGFPRQIATIEQAVSLMGRNPLRNLLTTVVATRVLVQLSSANFDMVKFWKHSIRTALIARNSYARLTSLEQAEPLFIAGLVHDIGHLIMAQFAPTLFKAIAEANPKDDHDTHQIERQFAKFDHAKLGAELLRCWQLPPLLVSCVEYHHNPAKANEHQQFAYIIAIANQLAKVECCQLEGLLNENLEHIENWQNSGVSAEQWLDVSLAAEEQISDVMQAFNL